MALATRLSQAPLRHPGQATSRPRLPPRLVPAAGLRTTTSSSRTPRAVVVMGASSAGAGPTGPTGSTPGDYPASGSSPRPITGSTLGAGGGPTGGAGGFGGGGGAGGRGGAGGGAGGGLPGGWSWSRVLLTLLGIAVAVPAWQYVNRRYLFKPEPEHTIAVAEDAAARTKRGGKSAVGKAVSAVKHATVEPVVDTLEAIKHSDTLRAVQHRAEDVIDTVNVNTYDASAKAERGASKASKEVRHGYEDAKSKAADAASRADVTAHEAKVKGGRAVQRGKEKVSDTVYEAEQVVGRGTKGVLEGIKGAAGSVGRGLHVVADATERGIKSAANKVESAVGVRGASRLTSRQRKQIAYVAGGVALGTGVLAALYFYDKKGGDISGKVRKLQDRTKEAADTAVEKARQVLGRAGEPSGPTAPTTASTPSAGTAGTPSTGATIFGSGASGPTRPY